MSETLGSKQLGDYLKVLVRSLELDGTTHNYQQMATSNFGVMCQIVLGYTENHFHRKLQRWDNNNNYRFFEYTNFGKNTKRIDELGIWWKENLKIWWSINGNPQDFMDSGLFYILNKKGFTRHRILELEYLDNPIVNEALKDYDWGTTEKDIFEDKLETKLEPIMVTNTSEKWVDDKSLWGRMWGKKKKLTETTTIFTGEHNLKEEIVKVKVSSEIVPTDKNFKLTNHSIIYYKKWIELLEEKYKENSTVKFQDRINKLVIENRKQ